MSKLDDDKNKVKDDKEKNKDKKDKDNGNGGGYTPPDKPANPGGGRFA